MNKFLHYALLFILLLTLQVLVFNNINFLNKFNTFIYVYFLISLPINLNRIFTLISSFLLGLLIDIFLISYAINTISITFIAFLRPFILNFIKPFEDYEDDIPSIKNYGFKWWLKYTFIIILLHHSLLFFMEEFNFPLLRIFISTLLSLLFVTITEIIINGTKSERSL